MPLARGFRFVRGERPAKNAVQLAVKGPANRNKSAPELCLLCVSQLNIPRLLVSQSVRNVFKLGGDGPFVCGGFAGAVGSCVRLHNDGAVPPVSTAV